MTEYFTTSKLVYAAAAIEQGFEGIEPLAGQDTPFRKPVRHWVNGLAWRFPKTPRNVALMEAREGDIVMSENAIGRVSTFERPNGRENLSDYWKNVYFVVYWGSCDFEVPYNNESIIYRNGMPFPVWDKPNS